MFGNGRCVFVMLNPSTAGAEKNDPTVARCCVHAASWGYAELDVVNIFALRSTDPRVLKRCDDPVGPGNDRWILETCHGAELVVCAWGVHGVYRDRGRRVLDILRGDGVVPHALRLTSSGHPSHPLYLPNGLKPAAM